MSLAPLTAGGMEMLWNSHDETPRRVHVLRQKFYGTFVPVLGQLALYGIDVRIDVDGNYRLAGIIDGVMIDMALKCYRRFSMINVTLHAFRYFVRLDFKLE